MYDKQPIVLDGQMEVTISFEDERVRTKVYIKIQTLDSLLLSEVTVYLSRIGNCQVSPKCQIIKEEFTSQLNP